MPPRRYLDPATRVVNVDSREVLLNAGNVHCITQQQPAEVGGCAAGRLPWELWGSGACARACPSPPAACLTLPQHCLSPALQW